MPQETNENKKPKRRFSGQRRGYVDTFRWGFVPEEETNSVVPRPDTEKRTAKKPDAKKSLPATPVEALPSDVASSQKQSRPQKKAVKVSQTKKPKDVPNVKTGEDKRDKQAPKVPAGHLPKQSVPGKRQSKGSKRRTKIALPPYTAVAYDEDDEDLKLPSYGRTPIPKDDELPVPKPIAQVPHAPKSRETKPSNRHHDEVPAVSEVTSVGFRLRREQMVWDPDKQEYVPLVIRKEPEPPAPKKPLKQEQAADGSRRATGKEPSVRQKSLEHKERPKPEKSRSEKRQEQAEKPKPAKPSKPQTQKPPQAKRDREHKSLDAPQSESLGTAVGGRKPHTQTRTKRLKELPPRQGDSRRDRPPTFVDTHKPDPADIEADVSGFAELGVSEAMLEALRMVRYLTPTPIQAGVFQKVQAGTDLMGQARTGTGKTAAFSMPIIEGVETCPPGNSPVALILVPTRELAVQVRDEAIRLAYGRDIRITACYGGKPLAKQIERLKQGIDILVGTPGRILDLMNRRALFLDSLRWVVLDEADRMLDIGFRPDIEKILKRTPADRQTLLFSATLPSPVVRLAERYMKSPEVLDFSDKSVAVETIDQYYVTVDPERKFDALVYLLQEQEPQQAIIFTRTKRGADRLARLLSNKFEKLAAIHGDLQQNERDNVMAKVRAGTVRYLVATDVVGRGIDVTGISHIINYDIPKFCDDYVHRVGRTGRMGRDGVAFTFVTVQEGSELTRIEMRIDKLLERAELKGFESFTKPHDPNATLDSDDMPEPPKPVFGKPVRKVRRAL